MTLEQEAERLAALLVGRMLTRVFRHNEREVVFEFSDGTRFFANGVGPLELSVTGGDEGED